MPPIGVSSPPLAVSNTTSKPGGCGIGHHFFLAVVEPGNSKNDGTSGEVSNSGTCVSGTDRPVATSCKKNFIAGD
jgi:hypothetical protein